MSFKLLDRARMGVAGSPGTGVITLGGALAGYQTFNQAGLNNGDTFPYVATDGAKWEYGIATYSFLNNQISRAPNWTSAQSAAPISLTATTVVSATLRAEDVTGAQSLVDLSDVNAAPGSSTGGFTVAWDVASSKFVLLQPTYAALPDKPAIPVNASFTFTGLGDVNASPSAFTDGFVVAWNQTAGKYQLTPSASGATLAALGDVTITTPTNGQVLGYNSGSSKWVNTTAPGGAISTLSDVTLTSLSTNQVLHWNGTAWVNVTLSFALVGLSDVTITTGSGVDGYAVTWNNGTGKFVLTSVGGGGSALAILNNGSSVDTAAVSLNFVNATSITTASHAVTITLPTGGASGGTPPAVVQRASAQSNSSDPSVTFGSAPTNGNLMVAMVFNSGSNPSAASGWTAVQTNFVGNVGVSILTKTAGASESTTQTPTTGASGNTGKIVWEVSGVASTKFMLCFGESVGVPGVSLPTLPAGTDALFLGCIAGVGNTITEFYGAKNMTSLAVTGTPMVYADGDSTNSGSFGLALMFNSNTDYGWGQVVLST